AAARLAAHGPTAGPPGPDGALARSFSAGGAGPVHFTGALEGTAVLEGSDGLVRIELSLGADPASAAAPVRVPTDLVVVLDRSGSMAGEKIANARAAVRALLSSLDDRDRFALVAYSDGAQTVLP